MMLADQPVNKRIKNRPPPLRLDVEPVANNNDVHLLVEPSPLTGHAEADRREEEHQAEFYQQFESTLMTLLHEDELMPFNLHTAASLGITASVRNLIERCNVDPNSRNVGNWTALMYASLFSHNETVLYLLEMKANVNLKNPSGKTPLMLASLCGSESTIRILLQHGAALEERDHDQFTALMLAIQATHSDSALLLLDHGANPAVREEIHGQTPLYIAAQSGQFNVVRALIQRGVDADAKTSSGDSAYHVAMRNGYASIASLISEHQEALRAVAGKTEASAAFVANAVVKPCKPTQLLLPTVPTQYRPKSPYSTFFQRFSQFPEAGHPIPELIVEDADAQWFSSPGDVMRRSPEGVECAGDVGCNPFHAWPGSSTIFKQAIATGNRQFKRSVTKPYPPPTTTAVDIISPSSSERTPSTPWDCFHMPGGHERHPHEVKLPRDLSSVLVNLGLAKYQTKFEEQDIDLQVFLTMNEADLREIGINSLGARRKCLSTIEYFQTRSSHYRISEEFMVNAWVSKKDLNELKMAWNEIARAVAELRVSGPVFDRAPLVDRLVKSMQRAEVFFNKY